jgi:hypothetical protein
MSDIMSDQPQFIFAKLDQLQPSQLYISQDKLSAVQTTTDFSTPDGVQPIPVKILGGLRVMTDGHTRAFAAYLAGLIRVPTYDDPDDLDWEAYQICVDWCRSEGIHSVADLTGRVVNTENYERLWYNRCRAMQAELAKKRGCD